MSLSKPARKPRSKTIEKLEELVKCAVCHELLNNPKVFPCLHSYCYECIVKLSKRECGLVCPECRAPVEVRSFSDHCSVSVRAFFKRDDRCSFVCKRCVLFKTREGVFYHI
jgi:hypothetical protein